MLISQLKIEIKPHKPDEFVNTMHSMFFDYFKNLRAFAVRSQGD